MNDRGRPKVLEGKVPFTTLISLIRSWVINFVVKHLREEPERTVVFWSYPYGLVEITDSRKGRGL